MTRCRGLRSDKMVCRSCVFVLMPVSAGPTPLHLDMLMSVGAHIAVLI